MIKTRELAQMHRTLGAAGTLDMLSEALRAKELRAEDFSIRSLFEGLVENGRELVDLMDPRSRGGVSSIAEAINAVDTSAFSNITGQIVYSRIWDAFAAPAFVGSTLIDTIPTTLLEGEKIAGMSQIGDESEVVEEGHPYPEAGFSEDYQHTPPTKKRGMIVSVTREAIFYDRTGLILRRAAEVGQWLGLNKEKRILDAIIDGNTTEHRHKWKGTTYATYQSSTPWINLKTTNGLSDWANVDAAEQLFANLLDPHTGEPIMVMPDTLLVTPEKLATAQRIVGATEIQVGDGATGGTATRSANPLRRYRVASSPLLRARLSAASQATTNWYIGDFRAAFAYMEAFALKIEQQNDSSDAAFERDIVVRWKASERGAVATLQPRAVVKNTA